MPVAKAIPGWWAKAGDKVEAQSRRKQKRNARLLAEGERERSAGMEGGGSLHNQDMEGWNHI